MKKFNRYVTENMNSERIAYHVTLAKNLSKIGKFGLQLKTGKRSQRLSEEPSIFLFPTIDDAEDGVSNWLGDEFPDDEPLALLEVIIPQNAIVVSEVDWEIQVKTPIPPENIKIIETDF